METKFVITMFFSLHYKYFSENLVVRKIKREWMGNYANLERK